MAFVHEMFEQDIKKLQTLLDETDLEEKIAAAVRDIATTSWVRGCAAMMATVLTQTKGGTPEGWYPIAHFGLTQELGPIKNGEKSAAEMDVMLMAREEARMNEAIASAALAELDMSGEKVN